MHKVDWNTWNKRHTPSRKLTMPLWFNHVFAVLAISSIALMVGKALLYAPEPQDISVPTIKVESAITVKGPNSVDGNNDPQPELIEEKSKTVIKTTLPEATGPSSESVTECAAKRDDTGITFVCVGLPDLKEVKHLITEPAVKPL